MLKSRVRHDNARHPEQIKRMKLLEKEVGCFFCHKNYLKVGASKAIHESKYWYIKKSDYPYDGAIHHYLIAPKTHLTKVTRLSTKQWTDLLKMVKWLEKHSKVKGYSLASRNGDFKYTGATLDHLHFHFVSGGVKKKKGTLKDNIIMAIGHKAKR